MIHRETRIAGGVNYNIGGKNNLRSLEFEENAYAPLRVKLERSFIREAAVFSIVIPRTLSSTKDNRRYTFTMSTYRFNVIAALMLLVVSILVELGSTQSGMFPYEDKRQSLTLHKYCGKNLSNALRLLCDGVYNSMFKKSGQDLVGLEMEMDDYPFGYDESYPFRSAVTANAMMGRFAGRRFRRESRGVYDECCAKACSIQELTSYCGRRH
ncbi:hypothetical protein KPH14_007723 [Odynerus spinipes]|uniref:Insulin-like domain-containing protein n=1 Tax=Odynerus spinipes TaxID=1348599 RepID=A0AAD9RIZ8_9HYME|nr:hypothetical protein KPH14_007723 [Odynerus spinipes]